MALWQLVIFLHYQNIDAHTYTVALSAILSQPFGQERAEFLRKLCKMHHFEANKNKQNTTAFAYSNLSIAHANTMLAQFSQKAISVPIPKLSNPTLKYV